MWLWLYRIQLHDYREQKVRKASRMSSDNIQRQIEFILEHQAKFSEDIGQLRAAIGELRATVGELTDVQKQQGENLDRLTADVQLLAQVVEANRLDTREAIDNLIISNEVTRKLAEDVARLAIGTNQRVTGLEQRVTDLESKR
jgi:ABC-type transporter Mla subunit MlaD